MSIEDKKRWDERHLHATSLSARSSVLGLPRATSPAALALDLACGQGRHAAALARLGYGVVAMDVSMQALGHARRGFPCAQHGPLLALQADTDHWPFAPGHFDLIVQVDFLERRLFPLLRETLRRGGLLLIDTFLDQGRANAEGPSRASFLLSPGELLREFGDFRVLRYDEVRGDSARASILARKP